MRRKPNAGVSTPEKATPRRSTRGRGRRSPSKSPEPEPSTEEREYPAPQSEDKNSSSDEESTSRKETGKGRGGRGRSASSRRKTDDCPPARARRNSRRDKESQEDAAEENGAKMQGAQDQEHEDTVDLGTAIASEDVMEPIPEETSQGSQEDAEPAMEEMHQDEQDGSDEVQLEQHDDNRETGEMKENSPDHIASRKLEKESRAAASTEEKVSQKNGDEEEEVDDDANDKQEEKHCRDDHAHDDSEKVVTNRSQTSEESDSNESGQEEGEIVGKCDGRPEGTKKAASESNGEEVSRRIVHADSTMDEVAPTGIDDDAKQVLPVDKGSDRIGSDAQVKKTNNSDPPQPPRRRPRFSSRPDKDLSPVKASPEEAADQNDEELEAGEIKDSDHSTLETTVNDSTGKESGATKEPPRIRPLQRKRRWLSSKNADSKPAVITISTDSLKNIISDVKPVPLADVNLESSSEPEGADGSVSTEEEEDRERTNQRKSRESNEFSTQQQAPTRQRVLKSAEKENIAVEVLEGNSNGGGVSPKQKPIADKITITRKISIVSDDGSIVGATGTSTVRPPSPAKHHTSNILYITNLVRPFTVLQLKGLLARTGKIVENGFWIDKIKSKCYVRYETEDEATETRHALHGIRWPVSNPKCLIVDFGSEEPMEKAILSTLEDGAVRATVEGSKEGKEFGWSRDASKKDEEMPARPVREWDLGKKDALEQERDRNGRGVGRDRDAVGLGDKDNDASDRGTGRDRERDRGRIEGAQRDGRGNRVDAGPAERTLDRKRSADREFGRERRRSTSLSPARKFKKKENEPPIRLLDDLFRKTKATPCIYWLPLTTEQIAVKEEQRRKNMAEHQRRLEEQRKQQEEERERERKRERERRDRERERDRERDRERERDRDRDRERRRSRSRERSRDDGGRRRHR